MPEARRPHASDIHEAKKRPAIATTLIQITSLDASGGVILSTITNSVTCHKASATPPVWVSPVRQPATMLRGYLKISSQRVCSTTGGNRRQRDLRGIHLQRPGERSARLFHSPPAQQPVRRLGDKSADVQAEEGRQQPDCDHPAPADIGRGKRPQQRGEQLAGRQHRRGDPGEPAALMGRRKLLHQGDVDRIQASHAEPDEEAADDQIDPPAFRRQRHRAGRERDVQHGGDQRRAPSDLVGHQAVQQRAERRTDTRGEQDRARLSIGQMPLLDDEGQDKADQEEVEEIEHVAERRGARDLPLVSRQLLLALQKF